MSDEFKLSPLEPYQEQAYRDVVFRSLRDVEGRGEIRYHEARLFNLIDALRSRAEAAEKSKDGAYAERDKCVAMIATLAHALGWPVWLSTHVGEWEDDWRNIVFIETPAGQVSWHYHDSERPWFSWIGFVQPREPRSWDGHSTPEKYERLFGLVHDGVANEAAIQYRRILGHALHMTSEAKDWQATVGCESDAPGNSTCIDMGVDPCGPCKIGQAAEALENLLRGRTQDSWEARATAAETAADAARKERDEALKLVPELRESLGTAHARACRTEAERDAARAENETLNLKLAACGVAAMCNTPASMAAQRIDNSSPYYSASYGDVCRMVDREMAARAENVRKDEALRPFKDALKQVGNGPMHVHADSDDVWISASGGTRGDNVLTVGDFRRAAAALAPPKDAEPAAACETCGPLRRDPDSDSKAGCRCEGACLSCHCRKGATS